MKKIRMLKKKDIEEINELKKTMEKPKYPIYDIMVNSILIMFFLIGIISFLLGMLIGSYITQEQAYIELRICQINKGCLDNSSVRINMYNATTIYYNYYEPQIRENDQEFKPG